MDVIELTQELIAFDTINPPGNEMALALHLSALLQSAGFDVSQLELSPGRPNIIARIGGSGAPDAPLPLCFTGHLDTVPLGTAPWTVDPFGGEVVDGRLYGRGSSDMKSGVAAMVVAAIEQAQDLRNGPGLLLLLTVGEETGCEGASDLLRHLELGPVGALLVGEPTSNQPKIGHKGALWLLAETHGKSAHGAMPELGVNAIYRSIKLLAKLEDFGFNVKPHPQLGSPTLSVGSISAGENINSVPNRAEIGIDMRTLPGMRHEDLFRELECMLGPELDALGRVVDLDGVWTDPGDAWVRRVFKDLGLSGFRKDDEKVVEACVPFFTDASVLTPGLGNPPTIILGPGETELAHQTDEYCLVERLPEAVSIYSMIMRGWQRAAEAAPMTNR